MIDRNKSPIRKWKKQQWKFNQNMEMKMKIQFENGNKSPFKN